ncbi:MAG: PTS sugar transporter subunit IIA [Olsenella sp.]|nr:PTS sugar transporter subunit IIA [Olsenella sp.]
MSEFLEASHVFLDNPAANVDEALDFISEKAVELGIADDKQATLDAFKAREAEGTTGMMEGFAIPHAKGDAIKKVAVMVVKFSGDVEWETMDKKPVKVAIALLVPGGEVPATHLQLLSKVAVMLMDESFRSETVADADASSIAERINSGLLK